MWNHLHLRLLSGAADPGDTLLLEDDSGSLLLEDGFFLLLESSP